MAGDGRNLSLQAKAAAATSLKSAEQLAFSLALRSGEVAVMIS